MSRQWQVLIKIRVHIHTQVYQPRANTPPKANIRRHHLIPVTTKTKGQANLGMEIAMGIAMEIATALVLVAILEVPIAHNPSKCRAPKIYRVPQLISSPINHPINRLRAISQPRTINSLINKLKVTNRLRAISPPKTTNRVSPPSSIHKQVKLQKTQVVQAKSRRLKAKVTRS